jgi:hypothetical protein
MAKSKKKEDDKTTKGIDKPVENKTESEGSKVSSTPEKTKEEKAIEKINTILPMANLNNRINALRNQINPKTSGIGTSERAINVERTIFLKQLEDIQNVFIKYFKDN